MKLALASFLILIAFGFPLLAHPLQPATRRTLVFTQVNIIGCCRLPKLALLVEAGLTPLQALQSATFNAARFFQQSRDWGTIEQGKVADLVLLDANPLRDIRNTQKINGSDKWAFARSTDGERAAKQNRSCRASEPMSLLT